MTWQPEAYWGNTCTGTTATNNNQYSIYVGTSSSLSSQVRVAVVPGTQTFYDYTVDTAKFPPGSRVYWSIGANNGCDAIEQHSASFYFISSGGIRGTVYFDAANTCSTSQGWGFGGLSVSAGGSSGTVQSNGTYSVSVGSGTYTVNLVGIPASYACSTGCAQSCPTKTGVSSPSSNQNFFLTFNPGPWWQVKDSDISSNGDLKSTIPTGQLFDLAGGGAYPGIPSYAGATNLTAAKVSNKAWLAQDTPTGARVFDYQYFANQIPSDTNIYNLPSNTLDQTAIDANVTPSYGYYWYKFDGSVSGLDLNLGSALNIGSKKVILLINSANFNIGSTINLTDGQGFFMVIAGKTSNGSKGNITVDPAVGGGGAPNLEGIYSADGAFLSGLGVTQLYIRGSVAAYGGVSLQRDLANDTNPAEFFEYAPDQIMLFPSKLGFRKINWKEVAP